MQEHNWLADKFEAQRPRLQAVAWRMLGSQTEADDAVQEAWLRVSRADVDSVDNLAGWLTTVVSRICLDMLRSRTSRREAPIDSAPVELPAESRTPEQEAVLADAVGEALMVVLDTLNPAERLAFVLHDLFGLPFDEIAPMIDRTAVATRQLASRARRRVRGGADAITGDIDTGRQREVVSAFMAAARNGEFDNLVSLLDPDAVIWADPAAAAMGSPASIEGAEEVATFFNGKARGARLVTIDGDPGAVWAQGHTINVAFDFTVVNDRIVRIEFIGSRDFLDELPIEFIGRARANREDQPNPA